jgi:tetratricopeptide (TPR) repeat protein
MKSYSPEIAWPRDASRSAEDVGIERARSGLQMRERPRSPRRATAFFLVGAILAMANLPCHAVESDPSPEAASDRDYVAGKNAIEAKNWKGAIRSFSSAERRAPDNADIHNYLGYAYRNAGMLDPAFKHYQRALQLDPRHRGAHEYIGEAYLMVNDPAKAEEHLAALEKICLLPCEELDDLKRKIEEYRKKAR